MVKILLSLAWLNERAQTPEDANHLPFVVLGATILVSIIGFLIKNLIDRLSNDIKQVDARVDNTIEKDHKSHYSEINNLKLNVERLSTESKYYKEKLDTMAADIQYIKENITSLYNQKEGP